MPAEYTLCKEGWRFIQRMGVKGYSGQNYTLEAHLTDNAGTPDWNSLNSSYPPRGSDGVGITSAQWTDYADDPEGSGLIASGPSCHLTNNSGAPLIVTGFFLRIANPSWTYFLVAVYKFENPITLAAGASIDRTPIVGVQPCP